MGKLMDYVQKHRKIIYLIAAVVIILVSCYFGLQPQENWSAEKYGTTNDGQIPIKKDTEFKVEFTISENDFQGVFVQIAPTTKNFVNETLRFTLTDNANDQVIAEYDMLLKNEVMNASSFAVLPCEKSKGKKVTLKIKGKDINEIPFLVISENSNVESKLYVNGKLQKKVLAFSGVYMYFTGITLSDFIKGGILLFLLALIYWWPYIYENANISDDSKKQHRLASNLQNYANKMTTFFKRHKKAFAFLCFTIVYFCFTVFVYKCYIVEVLENRNDIDIVEETKEPGKVILDSDARYMEQTFKSEKGKLSSVAYKIMVDESDPDAVLHVTVEDAQTGYCYHEDYVDVDKLPQGKDTSFEIFFQKEFTNSNNKNVKIILEAINFGDTGIEFTCGDCTSDVDCIVSGKKLRCPPVLSAAYDNNDFILKLFLEYVLWIYVFFGMVYYLLCIRKTSVEHAFLPIAFMLGMLYMLAIPVYVVPDENAHVDTAYFISNSILGIEDSEKVNYLWKRAEDIETEYANEHEGKMYMYRRLYAAHTDRSTGDVLEESYGSNAISNAGLLFYLPAAIGLTVARLLHLSSYYTLLMGRLFNLLAYIGLTYLGIRKLPLKKSLLGVIATLPISMQQAASFSYDSILNGMAFLFLGYCFYFIRTQEKIKNIDVIILLSVTMMMAYVKGGVYMPLCFLLILIPIERKWKFKSYLYFIVTSLFVLCAFMQRNLSGLMRRTQVLKAANVDAFTGKVNYTIAQVLRYPFTTILVMVNSLFNKGDDYVKEFFGGTLGSLNYKMMWINVIIIIGVIVCLCKMDTNGRVFEKKKSYAIALILLLGSVFLIMLSMMVASTSVDSTYVKGVQGRYFIPVGLIPFLLYGSKSPNKGDENRVMTIYYINHVVMLFYIVMLICDKV